MISIDDRKQIADGFKLDAPFLDNEIYRSRIDKNKMFHIQYFWIAKFFRLDDLPWENLLSCIIKDKDEYYGLLMFSGENEKNVQLQKHSPKKLHSWNDPVANTLSEINLLVDETAGSVFGNSNISYDLMLSSRSLKTHIDVNGSTKIRPSIDELTEDIYQTVKLLIDMYNDESITKMLFKQVEE